jgi:hypothetical protein
MSFQGNTGTPTRDLSSLHTSSPARNKGLVWSAAIPSPLLCLCVVEKNQSGHEPEDDHLPGPVIQ